MGAEADLLLVPLGVMVLLAVCAFFVAFFHRGAARGCAGFAVAIAALILLLILQGSHWDFGWLLHLLLEPSPLFWILCASLVLSFITAFAPLRHADRSMPTGGYKPGGPRWVLISLACATALFLVGYGVVYLISCSRGEQKTEALLAGDPNIHLDRLEVFHQQRRLLCNDPEVLRYLEERFRNADPEQGKLGISYEIWLVFKGGGAQSFSAYWSEPGHFTFFVGMPGDGGTRYLIHLTQPRPKQVDEFVGFLLREDPQVAGTILIMEPEW